MINNCIIIGRLTRDPELKKTQSGVSFIRFTLAVNRSFKDDSGETQADFISCIAWRAQAENLAKYMRQGSLIGVEGRIQTGSYESDKGTVYTTDVVANNITFLESKGSQNNNGYQKQEEPQYYEQDNDLSDDLPF